MMHRIRKSAALAGSLFALLILASPAQAANSVADKTFDALLLRPFGFVRLVVGAAYLLPAYPLSLASGQSDEVLERLVTEPFEVTFRKPLGDI